MTRLLRAAGLAAAALVALPACVAAIGVQDDDDDDRAAAAHDRRLLELEGRMDRIEGAIRK